MDEYIGLMITGGVIAGIMFYLYRRRDKDEEREKNRPRGKCKVCGEELHEILFLGRPGLNCQCLNSHCKQYQVAVYV
jgi:hypothetical protein